MRDDFFTRCLQDVRKYISEVSVSGAEDLVKVEEQDGMLVWLAGWWNHGVHTTVQFLAGQKKESGKTHSNFTNKVRGIVNNGYETIKQWTK